MRVRLGSVRSSHRYPNEAAPAHALTTPWRLEEAQDRPTQIIRNIK